MALTQMQLIQSLGEAMAWFERETQWGVEPTELKHLCGRIGELYAAVITNGQMAVTVNQQGYDVVSADGERISVKTTAMMGATGHVSFNPNSLNQVDRVIVLRINSDEMQVETLLDASLTEAFELMTAEGEGRRTLPLSRLVKKTKPRSDLKVTSEVTYQDYVIRELESGTIEVERNGEIVSPAKPVLREQALALNVPLVNSRGQPFNTRQLGSLVIRSIQELAQSGVEEHGITSATPPQKAQAKHRPIAEARYNDYLLRELETGTIEIERNGVTLTPVKPVLREMAEAIHVPILNSQKNPFNTRQLGKALIERLRAIEAETQATLT